MVVNAALLSKLLSNSPKVLGVPSRHAFGRIHPGGAVTRRKAARCSHGASLCDRGHSARWSLSDTALGLHLKWACGQTSARAHQLPVTP